MAHVKPDRSGYRYVLASNPDGTAYVGQYANGDTYYNVLAVRESGTVRYAQRIVARTHTLEKAQRLVKELTECTAPDNS